MDSRERLLCVINNDTPDRLPCQVHSWMDYYLKTFLGGIDQYAAYDFFKGMDQVIYENPLFSYADTDLGRFSISRSDEYRDDQGTNHWRETIATPDGQLTCAYAKSEITTYDTEHIIKTETDFEIWKNNIPLPQTIDWSPIYHAKNRIKNKGIVRGGFFGFGQGSPWQDFCILYGTEPAIMATFDKPDWVHYVLGELLKKKLAMIERAGTIPLDLVETGGGAGSSTVISPDMYAAYCLPYDQKVHAALHAAGTKAVYHLCGGIMPLLDLVQQNDADGLETMTPPTMGGDCDLAEAYRRINRKLFLIGGFDQNRGFENGTPTAAAQQVKECHTACSHGGYICSPSDHFFQGDPQNIQAFVDEAVRCRY